MLSLHGHAEHNLDRYATVQGAVTSSQLPPSPSCTGAPPHPPPAPVAAAAAAPRRQRGARVPVQVSPAFVLGFLPGTLLCFVLFSCGACWLGQQIHQLITPPYHVQITAHRLPPRPCPRSLRILHRTSCVTNPAMNAFIHKAEVPRFRCAACGRGITLAFVCLHFSVMKHAGGMSGLVLGMISVHFASFALVARPSAFLSCCLYLPAGRCMRR